MRCLSKDPEARPESDAPSGEPAIASSVAADVPATAIADTLPARDAEGVPQRAAGAGGGGTS